MDERRVSIFTGTIVVVSFLLFILILNIYVNWKSGTSGFKIHLKFDFLNGITIGAPVKLSGGKEVGKVYDIYQKDLQTYLVIKISNELKGKIPVSPDTRFAIFSTSLFGQKYINIEIPPVKAGDRTLKDNDVYTGIDPPSIDSLFLAISYWFDGKSEEEVIENMKKKMELLTALFSGMIRENRDDVTFISGVLQEYYQKLTPRLKEMEKQLTETSQIVKGASREDLITISKNMEIIVRNYDSMIEAIKMEKGSAGKILKDEKIKKNSEEALKYSKEFLQCINNHPLVLVYKESCPAP